MNGRKFLSLAIASVAVLSLAFGSGAFSSVSAERGVSVSVVDDENAFVGYDSSFDRPKVNSGDQIRLVKVTNQFAQNVTVTNVKATFEGDPSWSIDVDGSTLTDLDPGDHTIIKGTVTNCEPGDTEIVHVTVTVSGTGVWAKIFGDSDTQEREFQVSCEDQTANSDSKVIFKGSGQVRINTTLSDENEFVYWTTNSTPNNDPTFTIHNKSTLTPVGNSNDYYKFKHPTQAGGSSTIVAVYFPTANTTYHRPASNSGNGNGWGAGDGEDESGRNPP